MSIRDVVLRGYGNGTFSGTITKVVLRGFVPVWGGAESPVVGAWSEEGGASGSWVEEGVTSGSWTKES